jgi:hypothetical protein
MADLRTPLWLQRITRHGWMENQFPAVFVIGKFLLQG